VPNDQTEARREHLERLRDLIGNVYPNKYRREFQTDRRLFRPAGDDYNVVRFARPIKDKHISNCRKAKNPSTNSAMRRMPN
jgi:hypothetical protein